MGHQKRKDGKLIQGRRKYLLKVDLLNPISTKLMNLRKLPRKEDCNKDCISNLPDDIICRIMSSLPTVDAVKTSALSKEWEYRWTSICNIDITDEKRKRLRRKECRVAFVNFMRRVTSRATNVRKLRLCLVMNYKASETKSWLSALLKNKIESLHVETPFSHSKIGTVIKLPTSNCFTNLKSLHLECVCIRNENPHGDTLVLNFPVLETFKVSKCHWFRVELVEIYAPALIKFSSHIESYNRVLNNNYTLNIHSDMLAEFTTKGDGPEDIFVIGSKVVCAKFCNVYNLDEEPMHGGLRIHRLLKEFASTLDQLTISLVVAKAILESKQGVPLTSFSKLTRLAFNYSGYLHASGCISGAVLLEFLHAMPCLKCLNFCVMRWDDFDFEAVEAIPSCVTSSLEKIVFVDMWDSIPSLLRLAKYLLKTALRLKEFHVYGYYDNKNVVNYFMDKISAYPTGSAGVTFTGL